MAQAIDPVGNGYIDSLAQPGGNTTGFTQFEYSLAGKWMELLKEVAPGTRRVGVLTVYPYRVFASHGGLITYGPDIASQYRHAAGYVNRILKGENPANLPVQAPTKYELVINLKTAKAFGLTVPDKMLALADEVIE